MARCYFCGKGPRSGFNVSHSNRHTKRRWLPNLQPYTVMVEGKPKRVRVCTRCMRTQVKWAR